MKRCKKILACALALCLVMGVMSMPALAARMEEEEVVMTAPAAEETESKTFSERPSRPARAALLADEETVSGKKATIRVYDVNNEQKETVYTVAVTDTGITATADNSESAAAVWDYLMASGTGEVASTITNVSIAQGSWLQLGNVELVFAKNAVGQGQSLGTALQDAVRVSTTHNDAALKLVLKKSTRLAVDGIVKLTQDMAVTVTGADLSSLADSTRLQAEFEEAVKSGADADQKVRTLLANTLTAVLNSTNTNALTVEIKLGCEAHNFSNHQGSWGWDWDFSEKCWKAEFGWACQNGCGTKQVVETITPSMTKETSPNAYMEFSPEKDATCTEAGTKRYTAYVTINGKTYNDTNMSAIEAEAALGHEFDTEHATWVWAANNLSATVTATCKRCNKIVTATGTAAKDESRHEDPTYDAPGKDVYQVTVTTTVDNKEYTFSAEKEVTLPQLTRPSDGGGSNPGGGNNPGGGDNPGGGTGTDPEIPPVVDPELPPVEDLNDPDTPLVDKPFLFEDVAEADWFYDAVKFAVESGIMKGVSDTVFSPMEVTTRGSIITMIHRLEAEPEGLATFPDVVPDAWYSAAVAWGADHEIVKGYGDGTFAPGESITREQLAAILYRYASFKGYDVSASAELDTFADGGEVNSWAVDAVRWAVGVGLIQGKSGNRLDPAGTASRGEAAAMMMRFDQLVAQEG